jgi:hypothetical protein
MTRTVLATLTLFLLLVSGAHAADPGRWQLVNTNKIPLTYYQGVTDVPGGFAFSGHIGVYRTDAELNEVAANHDVMGPEVHLAEGYDHIGDLTYDARREGGRLLLPLECYYPGTPNSGNTCPQTQSIGTGAIGVADVQTLQWRYYVKLDQTEIKKAMWAQVTPDGEWLWTQDGQDLLRYDLDDVNPANATTATVTGATGPAIRPVQRLSGVVPPTGISGATFYGKRLFVAGQDGELFQVWSIDLGSGERRLEIERQIVGESEGLATASALGGVLHWQIMPYNESNIPTYGIHEGALLTFAPRGKK